MKQLTSAVVGATLALLAVGSAAAQQGNCFTPLTNFSLGTTADFTWNVRVGATCLIDLRISSDNAVTGLSVARRPRLGNAGASAKRSRENDGRTLLNIAYRAGGGPPRAETLVLRLNTRNKQSGFTQTTFLRYNINVHN